MEHSRRNHLAKQPAGLAGCRLSACGRAATNPRTGCKPSSQGFSPDTGGCAQTADTGQSGATRHRADNRLQSPETMPSRVSGNSRIWSVPRVSPSAYCLPPIPRPLSILNMQPGRSAGLSRRRAKRRTTDGCGSIIEFAPTLGASSRTEPAVCRRNTGNSKVRVDLPPLGNGFPDQCRTAQSSLRCRLMH